MFNELLPMEQNHIIAELPWLREELINKQAQLPPNLIFLTSKALKRREQFIKQCKIRGED